MPVDDTPRHSSTVICSTLAIWRIGLTTPLLVLRIVGSSSNGTANRPLVRRGADGEQVAGEPAVLAVGVEQPLDVALGLVGVDVGVLGLGALDRADGAVAQLAGLLGRVGDRGADRGEVVDVLAGRRAGAAGVEGRALLAALGLVGELGETLLATLELLERAAQVVDLLVALRPLLAVLGLGVEVLAGVGGVDLLNAGARLGELGAQFVAGLHEVVPPRLRAPSWGASGRAG
jgi:hypothetical protein